MAGISGYDPRLHSDTQSTISIYQTSGFSFHVLCTYHGHNTHQIAMKPLVRGLGPGITAMAQKNPSETFPSPWQSRQALESQAHVCRVNSLNICYLAVKWNVGLSTHESTGVEPRRYRRAADNEWAGKWPQHRLRAPRDTRDQD